MSNPTTLPINTNDIVIRVDTGGPITISNADGCDREELLVEYGVDVVAMARAGYNAYGRKAEWKTYDFKMMPTWANLGLTIQQRWCEAVNAIVEEGLEREYYGQ